VGDAGDEVHVEGAEDEDAREVFVFLHFVDAGGLMISVEERFVDSFVPSGGIIDGSGSGVVKVGKYFGQER